MNFTNKRAFLKTVGLLGILLLAGRAAPVHGQDAVKGEQVYVWRGSENLGGDGPLTFHFTPSNCSVVRIDARGKIEGTFMQPPVMQKATSIWIIIPGQAVYEGTFDSSSTTIY